MNATETVLQVLSFGEVVWDICGDHASLGGAPLNLAAHMAMHGAHVILASALGDRTLDYTAAACAKRFGIDIGYLSFLGGIDTAKCIVTCDNNGFPLYMLADHAPFDRISFPDIREAMDVICFGTLSLRYAYNRAVMAQILREISYRDVFCDINLRAPFYSTETILYCLSHATILKVSEDELTTVNRICFDFYGKSDELAFLLCERFPNIRILIVTLGENGSVCYDRQVRKRYVCPAMKTDVVSTVGAGDSFSAAFLTRYLRGCDISECLSYASDVSAMVCAHNVAFSEDMADFFTQRKEERYENYSQNKISCVSDQ